MFQQLAVPDIVKLVFQAAAFPDAAIALELAEAHPPREYVTQYFETDEAFIRRICEEEGIYFRFDEADAGDVLVLCDASPHAPAALGDALAVVDRSGQHNDAPAAWDCEALRVARTGKVTVRDYSPAQPAAKLEGTKSLGLANEQAFEVYAAPGGFDVASAGAGRAQHLLEAIRADAATLRFMTTATALAPGRSVELHQSDGFTGIANPEGKYFVTEVSHAWRFGEPVEMRVTAIPLDAPYRLAHTSPKPRIAGIQAARVTGAPGKEIPPTRRGSARSTSSGIARASSTTRAACPCGSCNRTSPGRCTCRASAGRSPSRSTAATPIDPSSSGARSTPSSSRRSGCPPTRR